MDRNNRHLNTYAQGACQNDRCDNWNSFPPTAAETGGNGCGCNGCSHSSCGLCTNQNQPDPASDGSHVFFEACDSTQKLCVTSPCEDQQSMGRVLDVSVTLENVCPGRRSAVGLTLTEVDENGAEYARGFRAVTVPAHSGSGNCSIQLQPVRFILPDDQSLQRRRHFICRVDQHYMDADPLLC